MKLVLLINIFWYSDSEKIKIYFQDKCFDAVISYDAGLKKLMTRISDEWTDQKTSKNILH